MTPELPPTACDALAALRARELSAAELIDATIALIEDSTLGAGGAREQARHAEARRRRAQIAGAIDRAMPVGGAMLAPGCPILAPRRDAHEWRSSDGTTRSIRDALLSCTVPLTQPPGPVVSARA